MYLYLNANPEDMNEAILSRLEAATDELTGLLSSLSETELNTRPFDGSWTAAQVGEHLLKSYGVGRILKAPVKKTERPSDQKVEAIKEVFLNFDIKMESPEFITPSDGHIDQATLLSSLSNVTSEIQATAEQLDLSETCTAFALPQMGEFTRLEWLHFMLYHTQRHNRQLKNICQKLTERASSQG